MRNALFIVNVIASLGGVVIGCSRSGAMLEDDNVLLVSGEIDGTDLPDLEHGF